MYCGNCGNKVNKNEIYCINCGLRHINNDINLTKNVENKKENKMKVIIFALIRSLICIIAFGIFYLLINSELASSEFGLFLIIKGLVFTYALLLFLLNKFIKFNNFSYYMLTNLFSILITFVIGFNIIKIDVSTTTPDMAMISGGFFTIFFMMALGFVYLINIVIDFIIYQINKNNSNDSI